MSSKISGIIVEIGGDTKKLAKAIDETNNKTRGLETELKQVERLLKLDPTNTELIAQKMQITKEATAAATEKVKLLDEALEKAKKSNANNSEWKEMYAPLQNELEESKEKAAGLSKSIESLKTDMENGRISADDYSKAYTPLKQQYDETVQRSKELTESVKKVNEQFEDGHISDGGLRSVERATAEAKIAAEKYSASLVKQKTKLNDIGGAAGDMAGELGGVTSKIDGLSEKMESSVSGKFESAMSNLKKGLGVQAIASGVKEVASSYMEFGEASVKMKTLLDENVLSYEDAQKGLLDLSADMALGANDVVSASYDLLSSGVKTKDMMEVSRTAALMAKAGFTDMSTAGDILTTTLSAYGLSAEHATEISDKLILAQDRGKITIGDFSQGLGKLISIAGGVNVNIDEVASAIASLSMGGLTKSEGITSLTAAFSNIIKPTAEAKKQAEELGLQFDAQSLKTKGLKGFIDELSAATGGNTEEMARLFGSTEALNAMTALVGEQNGTFNDTLRDMAECAGLTAEKFNIIASDPSFKMQQAMEKMKNAVIKLGIALSPLFDAIASIVSKIADLNPVLLATIGAVGIAAFAFAPLVITIQGATAAIAALTAAWPAITAAVRTACTAIMAKLGAVFTFIAANPVVVAIAAIALIVAGLIGILKHLWDTNEDFRNAVTVCWEKIQQAFQSAVDKISQIIQGVMRAFNGIITFVKGVFTGDWEMAWEGVKEVFKGIFESFAAIAKKPMNGIIGLLNSAIDKINAFIEGLNSIKVSFPDWFPFGVGGQSFHLSIPTIPNIPELYVGDNYHMGGRALVGEMGAEIVDLPRGSRVFTANQSQKMMQGSTTVNETYHVSINANNVKEFNDIVRIAQGERRRRVQMGV